MEILWLTLGLVCGTALTLAILYLLRRRPAQRAAESEAAQGDPELKGHAQAVDVVCLACLGAECACTKDEADAFEKEDNAEESEAASWIAAEEEMVIDDETAALICECEKERAVFIKAKKEGKRVVVPMLRFTLSRDDVFDHEEDFAQSLLEAEQNAITPSLYYRKKKHMCDTLYCGSWCFGLMYERGGVIKFKLRLDDETAAKAAEEHTAFAKALFPKGDNWYDLVIDGSFCSKKEVYDILDASFAFVLAKQYRKENEKYKTDAEAAKRDAAQILAEAEQNEAAPDPAFDTAVAEYEIALRKFRIAHKLPFHMTRKRLLHYANLHLLDEYGEILTRPSRCLPVSLYSQGKAYALVYEKLYTNANRPDAKTLAYVSLTVRVSDTYAAWLALRHPGVCRAAFPKNRNWYIVPVDGSFRSAQMVYRVLKRAKKFVEA